MGEGEGGIAGIADIADIACDRKSNPMVHLDRDLGAPTKYGKLRFDVRQTVVALLDR